MTFQFRDWKGFKGDWKGGKVSGDWKGFKDFKERWKGFRRLERFQTSKTGGKVSW